VTVADVVAGMVVLMFVFMFVVVLVVVVVVVVVSTFDSAGGCVAHLRHGSCFRSGLVHSFACRAA